jgi:hypothetical protein
MHEIEQQMTCAGGGKKDSYVFVFQIDRGVSQHLTGCFIALQDRSPQVRDYDPLEGLGYEEIFKVLIHDIKILGEQ